MYTKHLARCGGVRVKFFKIRRNGIFLSNFLNCRKVQCVITTAKLHSTNSVRGFSKICDGQNLWQMVPAGNLMLSISQLLRKKQFIIITNFELTMLYLTVYKWNDDLERYSTHTKFWKKNRLLLLMNLYLNVADTTQDI